MLTKKEISISIACAVLVVVCLAGWVGYSFTQTGRLGARTPVTTFSTIGGDLCDKAVGGTNITCTTNTISNDIVAGTGNFLEGADMRAATTTKTFALADATSTDDFYRFNWIAPYDLTVGETVVSYQTASTSEKFLDSGARFNVIHNVSLKGSTNLFTSAQTMTASASTTPETFSTGFNDATIAKGEAVWVDIITAETNQMTNFNLQLNYTID